MGLIYGFWENRPRHQIGCRLSSRDVLIKIRVGNLFDTNDSLVIGCNSTFDTDIESGIISQKSIQGQFTARFYNGVVNHLDTDINQSLETIPHESINHSKRGKREVYPIGTTVKLKIRNRAAYLVAIAPLNIHGNAKATFDDLKKSLPSLWEFISSQGDFGSISMPVLGSGYSRIPQPREVIIREIILSFIAACAAQRPCESLTIVISERDLYQHEVDLNEIELFIRHVCKYTDFADPSAPGYGTAISP